MKKKSANITLYILAAIVLIVSARYIQVRTNNWINARREAAAAPAGPMHELNIVTNRVYYTDTNLVATVQLNDLDGQPVTANLLVSLHQGDDIAVSPVPFTTDTNGRSSIALPLYNIDSGASTLIVAVSSELGHEYFERSVRIADDTEQNFIVHFDKGLYNPGDDVLFRVMALHSATARPIAGEEFVISIFDGNDNRVFVQPAKASDFGIISGRFSLADEVNSGFYRLTVEQNGVRKTEAMFEVSPFVLPRFEVTLTTDKSEYRLGETIYLSGTVMYFFGEPVNQGTANIYINNSRIESISLDENGEFALTYVAHSVGAYDIWVEVIDNSNFRVETSATVRATEGAFGIEVLPEHGYLVQGMPNTVYIFTHTANGEPVRTFLQITGAGFSRQVATDHNGIGTFVLEDVQTENHIFIHAIDMEDNSVQQDFVFEGVQRNVTISTNSPRFAMGETIYLELNRRGQAGIFKIYAYRNDRLLQVIETEHDRATLNLGDTFGLIDIYAVWIPNAITGQRVENLSAARRTVFIDPGNYMQLSVQSDRPEYEPGEFVNLNFSVTDSAGSPLTAALLVSIVDEAMLSLAANDLSIDNVRLALEDIRFGGDLDAATLYASLIAGASEQAITRLLLRQGDSVPFVQTTRLVNYLPAPVVRDWFDDFGQTMLNVLRFFVVAGVAIAFFVVLQDTAPYPGAPALDAKVVKGRRRTMYIVITSVVLFVLAMFFLSSCGAMTNDESASPAADWGPALNMVAEPSMPTPLPQAPAVPTAPVAEQAESEPDSAPATAPTEIETGTARVRRLFLETMLFVPELIARDGQAELAFILADNITTWNIQVVGNTQDGLVGHTQSSFRAFQPFFVDFELPRNSIRYDSVSIPVTVFNYTDYEQTVILTVAELDWFSLHGDAAQTLTVPSNRSVMVYIPITITNFGDFVFRVYADALGFADAAERPIRVNPEGFRIRQVTSSGSIESSTWQHLLFMQPDIADTRSAFITFYPSVMAQVIEGMENIFRMPFGCFEQTSSILYPNILALRYMQQNGVDNPALTQRALEYISAGYQRLLTFEVPGEPGGFSLFGHAPAETLLTAYGLMQLRDLTSVYEIDERVLERMSDFLFDNQNSDGTFNITGRSWHIPDSQRLAFNAYITWALSEAFPTDHRLDMSVAYLLSQLGRVDDNYTLALIANALVNTGHQVASDVVSILAANVIIEGDTAYVTSTTRDYFGAFGRIQYLQATALTSLVLSRNGSHTDTNALLVNYIISQRDSWGTWHSTQATILSLKALTSYATPSPLEDGQITIMIGDQQRVIDIDSNNTLGLYQVAFPNLERENIMDIGFPNLGRMTYKVVQEFFVPYDSVVLDRGFEVSSQMQTNLTVHQLVNQEIRIINTSGDIIKNGLVAVSIPQGFRVERSSLAIMQHMGIIERYEMRFDNINLYLRDTEAGEIIDLTIAYRPAFPVHVTGGHVRVFDYYNPGVEGFLMPVEIIVE